MKSPLSKSYYSLNQFSENVALFQIEDGIEINEEDLVVIDSKSFKATLPRKNTNCFCVGRATRVIHGADGKNYVVCRDGIFKGKNTANVENAISSDNNYEACYFEDVNIISKNSTDASYAGTVLNVYENEVVFRVDLREGKSFPLSENDKMPTKPCLCRSPYLLNHFKENITFFPVENGVTLKEGDFVVVNTRSLQATLPKKESGYFSVGCAIFIVESAGGKNYVLCKDGSFLVKNAKNIGDTFGKNDTGRVCYFDAIDSVSKNNINSTKAGIMEELHQDGIIIKIDVMEGSGLEW